MKECKCEVEKKDPNPLNLQGGDVVEHISGSTRGELYLVTEVSKVLRLHSLTDGNVWSSYSLMGIGYIFKKVNVCFKRED